MSTGVTDGNEAGRARDTWPKVLADNCQKYGNRKKAMRHKHYGIWQTYTWQDYYLDVKHLALGLLALGFERGDKLLIVGDNAPQWYSAELAAQANQGVSVGAYPDLTPPELRYIAENAEARFAVVQDQEQVDKLLEIKERLPLLEKIVYWSYKGLARYDNPLLLGYREVVDLGRKHDEGHPGLFETNVEAGKADDPCAVVYTAGTTGPVPKPAVHTHRTMRAGSESYLRLDPWNEWDELVPHLPPAGITGQWAGIGCHLLSGCVLNFAESPETQQRDTVEIGPTVVIHEARVWESLAATAKSRTLGVQGLKKLSFDLLMPVGYGLADARLRKTRPPAFAKAFQPVAEGLVLGPMKTKLGFGRARICYSTGALLSPEAFRFYHALGLPLKSVYGTAEGGALAGAPSGEIRVDSVGPPFEGAEVAITDSGEIVYRQPGAFVGYYKDPAGTGEVLKDGWFHTGDQGALGEDGHLRFVDNAGSVVELAGGARLAPQAVESRLRSSPHIRDAWVFAGPERAFVTAAVVINHRSVSRWAGQRRIVFNTFGELSQKPEVYVLVKQEIERLNEALPPECRVKKYVNLPKELDPDDGELTRTRNLRRASLDERYRELIEAVYAGKSEVSIEAPGSRQAGHAESKQVALAIASTGATSP